MGSYLTDFREYLRGLSLADTSHGGDWTSRWALTQDAVVGAPFDFAANNYLRLSGTVGQTCLTWNAVDGDAGAGNRGDCEVLALVGGFSGAQRFIGMRLAGTSSATATGYVVGYNPSGGTNEWGIYRLSAGGVLSTITNMVGPGPLDVHGALFWVRARIQNKTFSLKVWRAGDVWPGADGVEPTAWGTAFTAGSVAYTDGYVGLASQATAIYPFVHFFSVATAGGTATGPSSLPRAMETWAQDPSVKLDLMVRLERAARAGGAKSWVTVSRHGGGTTASDYPASTTVEAALETATIPALSLSAENLFAGEAGTDAKVQIVLSNKIGTFDDFDDYIFSGQRVILLAAERASGAALIGRRFEPLYAGIIDGEPEVGAAAVTFDAKGTAGFLSDTLNHRTFVGIPTCLHAISTSTSSFTAPSSTAYDVGEFTICGRFRGGGGSGSGTGSLGKRTSGATWQWWVQMAKTADANAGKLVVKYTVSGVEVDTAYTASAYDDGSWHWFAWTIRATGDSLLLVDGEVVLEQNLGVADVATGGSVVGPNQFDDLAYCDVRLYAAALTADEIRSLMAARAVDEDLRCVGMWRCDDSTGSTVTDYSATASHGSLAGVEATDWEWAASDLGDEALAGQAMPIVIGQVVQAPAVLGDAARFRFRYHDELATSGYITPVVKARGYTLEETTDYTLEGTDTFSVADMVGAQDQPVTVDVGPSNLGEWIGATTLAQSLLSARQGIDGDRYSAEGFEALAGMTPWEAGWAWPEPPTVRDAVLQLLPGAGLMLDRWGRLTPLFLMPPINPGPYGMEPLLEFMATADGGCYLDNDAGNPSAMTTSFTLAGWVLFHSPLMGATNGSDPVADIAYQAPIAACQTTLDGSSNNGWFIGLQDDQLAFATGKAGGGYVSTTPAGGFKPGTWYYIACVRDAGAGKQRIWAAAKGESALRLLVETSISGAYVASEGPLVIGGGSGRGFWGSVGYFQLYTSAKSDSDLNADLASRPPAARSGLYTYLPMNEGQGSTVACSIHTGGSGSRQHVGSVWGARWCPRLTYDLRKTTRPVLAGLKRLNPAWRAWIHYAKRHQRLGGSDIVNMVSHADRAALMAPSLGRPALNDQRSKYPSSRDIDVDSALAHERDATRLAGVLLDRFSPERRVAQLNQLRRDLLLLHLSDEVHLYHPRFAPDGEAYRAIELSGMSATALTGQVGLWG